MNEHFLSKDHFVNLFEDIGKYIFFFTVVLILINKKNHEKSLNDHEIGRLYMGQFLATKNQCKNICDKWKLFNTKR